MKMSLSVHVKTEKQERKVIKKDFGEYEVWVRSPAFKGRANNELIEVLADYFNVKPYNLRITRGLSAPIKILELSQ